MNKNEFIKDGNRYIKAIRKCFCEEKHGEHYVLTCKIIERGEKLYIYTRNINFISKFGEDKGFFLTLNAQEQVESAVNIIDEMIDEANEQGYLYDDGEFAIYYKYKNCFSYDYLFKIKKENGDYCYLHHISSSLEDIIRDIAFRKYKDKPFHDLLYKTTVKTLDKNPFYIAAANKQDKMLQKKIKLYYGIADEKECSWLSRLLGHKILPSLPEEYDKPYCVNSDTISVKLLLDSGYKIWHRPYFAMKDSTHGKWQLNPHNKTGLDAAPNDSASIDFKDYVEMIENYFEAL